MASVRRGSAEFWGPALGLIAQPQPESLGAMAQLIADHFAVDFCAIYLLERRTDELVLEASAGQSGLIGERLRVGQGISGLAALHNKTLQVAQMQGDPRPVLLPGQESQNNSIVAVPFGHELSGVFNLQSREQRSFDSAELAVLEREVSSSIVALISAIQTHPWSFDAGAGV